MSEFTTSQDRRPILGYEGLYEIDQQGNVYALFPFRKEPSGRMMNSRLDMLGYACIDLSKNAHTKRYRIHRLVMLAWNPIENSDALEVNHIDGVKSNNRIDNLEWVTHAQNMTHAHVVLNSLSKVARGERAGGRKLTENIVRTIRSLNKNGISRKHLAQQFNVSEVAIGHILTGKSWRHVE